MTTEIGPDSKGDAVLVRLQRALAHELRTPLHSMSGWLHVLESRLPDADPMANRALAGIRRAIDQQVDLADILTAAATSIAGESRSGRAPVDRIAIWHRTVADHPAFGERTGRRIETSAASPPPVDGDPDALARAFATLLDSLGAMTPSPARLGVRFDNRGDALVLYVDGGQPLADPLALESTAREIPPREFVGRFRARQVLAEHGILPIVADHPPRSARPLPSAAQPSQRGTLPDVAALERMPAESCHVLVVDDQPELREVLSALIEQRGDRATTASSAADALARLDSADRFDIAILDIAMPGEDGISLIGRIRQRERQRRMPAIALTAHANASLRRQALSAGFDVFLAKPVDPVLLFETIDRLARGDQEEH